MRNQAIGYCFIWTIIKDKEIEIIYLNKLSLFEFVLKLKLLHTPYQNNPAIPFCVYLTSFNKSSAIAQLLVAFQLQLLELVQNQNKILLTHRINP